MSDFDPIDAPSELSRRDLIGLVLLTLVAGLMIVVAIVAGGGVGD